MHALVLNLRLGKRVFPDKAREQTAALLDAFQPALLAGLMNYETVNGVRRPITGFPAVQFAHLADGFSLLGFGELGRSILLDSAAPLAQAFSEELGRHVGLDSQEITCTITPRPYAMRYRVPRMVVQKRKEHTERLADPVAGRALIEGLFLRSIQRQCAYLGIAAPEGLKVNLRGAEGEFAAQNGEGRNACAGLRGATFEMNARLDGLWAVGRLLSKGYGHFNASQQLGGLFTPQEGGHALRQ